MKVHQRFDFMSQDIVNLQRNRAGGCDRVTYHSIHIEMREHHPLIKKGPYKYLRHPYYLAVIFEVLGFPLVPNAYYAFLFSIFTYLPLLFIRIYFEEKAMIKKFGDEYHLYKRENWGLIPFKRVTRGRR